MGSSYLFQVSCDTTSMPTPNLNQLTRLSPGVMDMLSRNTTTLTNPNLTRLNMGVMDMPRLDLLNITNRQPQTNNKLDLLNITTRATHKNIMGALTAAMVTVQHPPGSRAPGRMSWYKPFS